MGRWRTYVSSNIVIKYELHITLYTQKLMWDHFTGKNKMIFISGFKSITYPVAYHYILLVKLDFFGVKAVFLYTPTISSIFIIFSYKNKKIENKTKLISITKYSICAVNYDCRTRLITWWVKTVRTMWWAI